MPSSIREVVRVCGRNQEVVGSHTPRPAARANSSVAAKATATSCCFVFSPVFSAVKCTHHRDPQLPASYTHQTPGSEPAHIQTHTEISPELCVGDTSLPMCQQLLDSNSQTTSNTAWADKIQQLVNSAHNQIQV